MVAMVYHHHLPLFLIYNVLISGFPGGQPL